MEVEAAAEGEEPAEPAEPAAEDERVRYEEVEGGDFALVLDDTDGEGSESDDETVADIIQAGRAPCSFMYVVSIV
eukprot:COSAG01_NODE_880_length_12937_cov_265.873968_8_plen_75_part_00